MLYPFQGCTITLTTSATAYNLVSLVQAAQNTLHSTTTGQNWDGTCFFLDLYSDPANGAGVFYVGGPDVSTTNYGYQLIAGGARQYGPLPMNAVPAGSVWAVGSINSLVMHIESGVI